MKKNFMLAASVAIALSSCSKNEISDIAVPYENPNVIGLNVGAFTTKADTETSSLEVAGNQLTFYSNDTTFDTRTFTYSSGEWKLDKIVGRESDTTWNNVTFPLEIFSLNDGTTTTGDVQLSVTDKTAKTSTEYLVATNTASQKDLVYYGATIAAIPTDGIITATYRHALSKVKMTYKASKHLDSTTPLKLYITQVTLRYVNSCEYATINSDGTIVWDDGVSGSKENHTYFKFDFNNANATLETSAYNSTTPIEFDNTNRASGYPEDMYIMPQTTGAYASKATDSTYVEVVYRSTDHLGNDILGYEKASDHPQYNSNWNYTATEPLYVKVAIPVSSVILEPSVYYNFVLDFDSSAIEIAEDGFFDKDGNTVSTPSGTFPLPSAGGQINPGTDAPIKLEINVLEWSDTPTEQSL